MNSEWKKREYSNDILVVRKMKKNKVGKRKRKGWRKRNPVCTLCTTYRWMGNIKGRHPMRELKQLDKEKHDTD